MHILVSNVGLIWSQTLGHLDDGFPEFIRNHVQVKHKSVRLPKPQNILRNSKLKFFSNMSGCKIIIQIHFFMKSDTLNIHLINTIHRINDSIKNQSYTDDKFRMLSKVGPESWALCAVVSAFFTPRWLIAVILKYRSLRGTYYYHLNINEMDHIVFITKRVHVMFHETASRKLLVFTLYVNPYMSNGVSHFNLLCELVTWQWILWRLIWVCTVCQRPAKWRQGLNELNITSPVLEITSRNFRKCKNLEFNL